MLRRASHSLQEIHLFATHYHSETTLMLQMYWDSFSGILTGKKRGDLPFNQVSKQSFVHQSALHACWPQSWFASRKHVEWRSFWWFHLHWRRRAFPCRSYHEYSWNEKLGFGAQWGCTAFNLGAQNDKPTRPTLDKNTGILLWEKRRNFLFFTHEKIYKFWIHIFVLNPRPFTY